jgi:uncharacterized protein (TIGR01244 family)
MMRIIMRFAALLAIVLLAFAVNADEGEQSVYVDLDDVVAAGKVAPVGGISSSGQPDATSLGVFADSGYAVVIDMRGPDENRGMDDFPGAVEATGMDYVAFPVVGKDAISFETAEKLDELLQGIDGPVLMHCGSGNRVGAVLALRESLNGADDDAAIAFGKDAGMTRLEPKVREVLEAD